MDKFVVSKKVQDVNVLSFYFNEINLEQREQLKKELSEQLKTGQTQFIIDLSKVGFVSSLVVATIVFFSKEVRSNNGTVKLSGLSGEAFSVFKLTQLDKIFELYETERDALESFKRSL
ncbi:STAS domain-containing protein [Candidatus Omnitrophota bacterium]